MKPAIIYGQRGKWTTGLLMALLCAAVAYIGVTALLEAEEVERGAELALTLICFGVGALVATINWILH